MRFLLLFGLVLSLIGNASAQHFTTDQNYNDAYSLLLDLKFDEASRKIQAMRLADEQNLATVYLEDLADFLFIVVTEDETQFNQRKEHKQKRLELLGELPSDSPHRLLAEGEIYLHWAFSSMRFGEYLSAAQGINKAFHSLEKNTKKHPDFLSTYKSMGLLHTLIGTVPDNYRWATKLMGVDGTIEQGIGEMEMVLQRSAGKPEYQNVRKETLFLLTFLHINLLNDSESLSKFQSLVEKESGPLMDFAKASLLKEQGKTDEAIALLENAPNSTKAFPYLNFLLGEMKLARMDKDANQPLKTFQLSFKGNSYVKAAQQKLAWHALLILDDESAYRKLISTVESVGNTMLDEDKAAQKECDSGQIPNKILLKARLQFDGGYYKEALQTLIRSNSKSLNTKDEELEFTYRLGRIHHEMGNLADAISYYNMTVENGSESKRYFAANSSLMLGLIYESLHQNEKARKAFEACSEFSNSEYRNSINQKAKAGLLRLPN
ncbi:MAG: tetratricopeptide repeat protein [Flavobacteriales bacterium]|nr:tetratricopeptide repeat protein [Flavobacteriales bacterium]